LSGSILFALVASDCSFAVDLFVSRELAEAALADVLRDEPSFNCLLSIEEIPDAEVAKDAC
jgi:hypothetical protein